MDKVMNFVMVALGGALGSMLRYAATLGMQALGSASKATLGIVATFAVNAVGSFAIGYLTAAVKDNTLMLLLTVGLCGGFTTFSTFSLQSFRLFQEGRFLEFCFYILASVLLCIALAGLGFHLGAQR